MLDPDQRSHNTGCIMQEALALLLPLMDWLERRKGELAGNEAVTNEVVASAHIENHAMKLFLWADREDREARFNKAGLGLISSHLIIHLLRFINSRELQPPLLCRLPCVGEP